jgi:hypothetical protein
MEDGDKVAIDCLPTIASPMTITMPPTNKMPMHAIEIIKIRMPPPEPLAGLDRILLALLDFDAPELGLE